MQLKGLKKKKNEGRSTQMGPSSSREGEGRILKCQPVLGKLRFTSVEIENLSGTSSTPPTEPEIVQHPVRWRLNEVKYKEG